VIKIFDPNTRRKLKMSRSSNPLRISPTDPMRDLFEACKSGDIHRIRALVDSGNVNAKDTAGRRSSPLHFSAGNSIFNRVVGRLLNSLRLSKDENYERGIITVKS
jgi:hypothetical protein